MQAKSTSVTAVCAVTTLASDTIEVGEASLRIAEATIVLTFPRTRLDATDATQAGSSIIL